jgi:inositol-phosphate transport system substrate-binding protein
MKRFRFILPLILLFILVFPSFAISAQDGITVTIRCKAAPPTEDWRCNNFNEVVEQVSTDLGTPITLNLIQDDKAWGDYKTEFVLASEANEAPDIILSGHEDIGAWAPAGLIMPLDDEIPNYPEFADVVPSLWDSMKYDGQIWGVPQDAEARPVFYSKTLLRDLGWTDEEIDSLPDRVLSGEYTFQDMLDTAQQAIDEGVVEEGNGFWHRTSNGPDFLYYYYGMGGQVYDEDGKLTFDQAAAQRVYELLGGMTESGVMRNDLLGMDTNAVWHPGVASGDTVLFAAGGTWNWAGWAANFVADKGGNDYLFENIGLMLIPAMDTGEALTLTHPLAYMVSSKSENPDAAMALIAAVTTPEANNRHAIGSFHLGILTTQIESQEYQDNPAVSQAHYMLDHTTFLPNDPGWSSWSNAYFTGIQAVESGDATPEEAVQLVVDQLTNELGDQIVIR